MTTIELIKCEKPAERLADEEIDYMELSRQRAAAEAEGEEGEADARIRELEIQLKLAQEKITDLRDANERAVTIAAEAGVTRPADVTVTIFTLPGGALEGLYQIEDSKTVTEFLAQNAFLHDLLVDAHGKIVEFFGEDADVHLELYEDPDFRGDRQLYAVIFTSLSAKDAIPIQDRFDEGWWLDNLARAQGKFNIIVEYV